MEFANKELIIITGVSGAGKSSAMGFLEDVGYYCIDNMPPVLLPTFIGLIANRHRQWGGVSQSSHCGGCALQ